MTSHASVLDKASEMKAEATRISRDASAELEAKRINERVSELLPLIERLGLIAETARYLGEATDANPVELAGLDDGRVAFARHAGLPSNQAFSAAKARINSVTARVLTELSEAWSSWTQQLIAALPLTRIPLLGADDQERARDWRDELQRLTKVQMPSRGDIAIALSTVALLAETLATVSDRPPRVLELLERLGERPALTLAELSDDDIRQLRQAEVDGQIEVRRRGS